MSSYIDTLAKFSKDLSSHKVTVPEEILEELKLAWRKTKEVLDLLIDMVVFNNVGTALQIRILESEMDELEVVLRKKHIHRLYKKPLDPRVEIIYIQMIMSLERIVDHCDNIADELLQKEVTGTTVWEG